MGERSGRITSRFESASLIELTKQSSADDETLVLEDDHPLADWDDEHVAAGSQSTALPATSRTQTLSDPMATALLAEVARRTKTTELDPRMVSAALRTTQEIDADVLAEVLRNEPGRDVK